MKTSALFSPLCLWCDHPWSRGQRWTAMFCPDLLRRVGLSIALQIRLAGCPGSGIGVPGYFYTLTRRSKGELQPPESRIGCCAQQIDDKLKDHENPDPQHSRERQSKRKESQDLVADLEGQSAANTRNSLVRRGVSQQWREPILAGENSTTYWYWYLDF